MAKKNPEAVAEALAKEQQSLLVWIRVLLAADAKDAQDVLQKTNLRILRASDRVDVSRGLSAWFRKIALREVQRHFRDKKRARVVFNTAEMEELAETLAQDAEAEQLFDGKPMRHYFAGLRSCLGKTDATTREFLRERYCEERKTGDIAKRHFFSPASLSVLLNRARLSLRRCIERFLKTPSIDDDAEELELLAFIDGELPQERTEALLTRLVSSTELRRKYIQLAFLDSAIPSVLAKTKQRIFKASGIAALFAVVLAWGATIVFSKHSNINVISDTEQTNVKVNDMKKTALATALAALTANAETSVPQPSFAPANSKRTNAISLDASESSRRLSNASALEARESSSRRTNGIDLNSNPPKGTIVYLI